MNIVVMPAGEYWLTDPCYAIPGEEWSSWVERAEAGGDVMCAPVRGHMVMAFATAYGDGVYDGVPVDSGLIGLVPTRVASRSFVGRRVLVPDGESLVCVRHDDGRLVFGTISIETATE